MANAVNEVDSEREGEEEREEWREDGRESEEREDTKTINNQNNKPPEPVYCTATHDTLPTLNPKPSGSSVKTLHLQSSIYYRKRSRTPFRTPTFTYTDEYNGDKVYDEMCN